MLSYQVESPQSNQSNLTNKKWKVFVSLKEVLLFLDFRLIIHTCLLPIDHLEGGGVKEWGMGLARVKDGGGVLRLIEPIPCFATKAG